MNTTFYKILPSGLKIVHRMSSSPVTYTGIMISAGTRDEVEKENGMAHYIEHCVFKGCINIPTHRQAPTTPKRELTSQQIIDHVEGIGGEINAYTTKEETVFYAATPKANYAQTLALIAGMVFQPTFPKAETTKEVGVIMEEIESYNDSPSELIYDDFEGLIFEGNALARPILGTHKTLKHISSSPMFAQTWMKQHYLQERMVIFSQGNISFAKVLSTVEHILDQLETSEQVSFPTRITPPIGPNRNASYRKHTHQAHAMLGGRAYERAHPKQLGLYLMNNILGGGSMSSRLNMNLREKRGWVYSIDSMHTPLSDCGYWNIYLASEPKMKDACLEECQKELRKLRENTLSSAQLHRALRQLKGQMAIAAENQENSVLTMAKQMLYSGCTQTWEETFQKIACYTPQQLQDIANEVYTENNQWLLTYE